jgi:hypothetical protein
MTVALYLLLLNLSMESSSGWQWGMATFDGISIGKRTSAFFKALGIFSLSFIIFRIALYQLFDRSETNARKKENGNKSSASKILKISEAFALLSKKIPEIETAKYLAIFLFIILLFKGSNPFGFSSKLILSAFAVVAITSVVRMIRKKSEFLNSSEFGLLFIAAFLFSLLITSIAAVKSLAVPGHFAQVFFIISLLLCLLVSGLTPASETRSLNIANLLLPLSTLPLGICFANEIYLIANSHSVEIISASTIFIVFLAMIALWTIERGWRQSLYTQKVSDPNALIRYPIFIFVVGLSLLGLYQISTQVAPEFFEAANPSLALQRFYLWDQAPILQNLNAHLGDETIFGFLYSWINGYNGADYCIYEFFKNIFLNIIILSFLYRILEKDIFLTASAFVVLPELGRLFPAYYAIVLLVPLALDWVVQKRHLLSYLGLLFLMAMLFLWRLDIGVAAAPALLIVLLKSKKIVFKDVTLGLGAGLIIALLFALPIWIVAQIRHIALWSSVQSAVSFFNSSQSFGYTNMQMTENLIYGIHYFVFPLLAFLLFYYLLHAKGRGDRISFPHMATLFLAAFYLLNFQRGLVRHGLIEKTDLFTSSFIYLLLIVVFINMCNIRSKLAIAFFAPIFLALLLYLTSVPTYSPNLPFLDNMQSKIETPDFVAPSKMRISRATENSLTKDFYLPFQKFFNENLAPDETFIDFTNIPMLYFYTQRKVPSYFDQPTLMLHNRFLQEQFIHNLPSSKVPIVIMEGQTDSMDTVPNSIRHWWLYQYLRENYSSFGIVNGKTIWLKNGQQLKWPKPELIISRTFNSGQPDVASAEKDLNISLLDKPLSLKKGYFYLVSIESSQKDLEIKIDSASLRPTFEDLSLNLHYYVLSGEDLSHVGKLTTTKNKAAFIKKITIEEGLYVRDYFSDSLREYGLRKFPWVLGRWEFATAKSQTQFNIKLSDHEISVQLPPDLKKFDSIILSGVFGQMNEYDLIAEFGDEHGVNGRLIFTAPAEAISPTKLIIPLGSQNAWWHKRNTWITIRTSADSLLISSPALGSYNISATE